MIVEPAMMNCGVILPEPGYLQGLKDIMHANGSYFAYDEVKTGATLAHGGATEVFGVTPDIICLAKAIGGGTPCGAIGATRELYRPIIDGTYDMAGTFNGNPLTMAASRATLLEVLTPDVYEGFNRIDKVMKDGLSSVIEKYRLPAYVTGVGAKGSVIYSTKPVREYRDAVGIDERLSYLAWLVPAEPWRVQITVDQAGDVDVVGRGTPRTTRRATSTTSRNSQLPSAAESTRAAGAIERGRKP